MKKLIILALFATSCAKQHYTEKKGTVKEVTKEIVVLSSGDTLNRFKRIEPIRQGDTLIFRYMTKNKMLSRVNIPQKEN